MKLQGNFINGAEITLFYYFALKQKVTEDIRISDIILGENTSKILLSFLKDKKFIDENRVLDYIYIKVKEHYLLSEKEEVFNILYNLFKHGAYQTFVSLGAIQVEGLFYDFCSAINGGVRKQGEDTLVNKVDKVFKNNRAQALIYYPYFAFDVPIYRNEVAHNGTIVSLDAEHIAIDILLDMYTVIKLMQQDWLPFNN